MLDVEKMAEALLAGTRALIAKELVPLRAENERLAERLAEVEAREIPEPILLEAEPLPDIAKMVSDAVAAIPAPEPIVLPDIAAMVARAVAEIPPARDGKDADMEVVAKMVSDAVAAIPAPVIPDPIAGKDGLSIAEVKQNADGELIVKMTNGETINAGAVRGAPGVGFDDLTVEHDGERDVVLRFARGEVVKEFPLQVPAIIDRGVWSEGEYTKGDAVTWGGSLWIAQDATQAKPGQCKSWRLAVKKGRDGTPSVRAE